MTTRNFTMALGAVGLIGAALVTAPRWTATLAATDGSSISGTATVDATMPETFPKDTMAPMPKSPKVEAFNASVSVTGAKANAMLAWHVHEGKCGAGGGIVGTDAAYPDIKVDGQGAGQATARVTRDMTEGKEYSVSVHKGATDEDPAIACGDLKAASRTSVPDARQKPGVNPRGVPCGKRGWSSPHDHPLFAASACFAREAPIGSLSIAYL